MAVISDMVMFAFTCYKTNLYKLVVVQVHIMHERNYEPSENIEKGRLSEAGDATSPFLPRLSSDLCWVPPVNVVAEVDGRV